MSVTIFEASPTMLQSGHLRQVTGRMPSWASWSIREASERTGYHPEYLRQLLSDGKIEGEKLGQMWLIKVESLQAYIKEAEQSNDGRFGAHKKK